MVKGIWVFIYIAPKWFWIIFYFFSNFIFVLRLVVAINSVTLDLFLVYSVHLISVSSSLFKFLLLLYWSHAFLLSLMACWISRLHHGGLWLFVKIFFGIFLSMRPEILSWKRSHACCTSLFCRISFQFFYYCVITRLDRWVDGHFLNQIFFITQDPV